MPELFTEEGKNEGKNQNVVSRREKTSWFVVLEQKTKKEQKKYLLLSIV